MQAIVPVEDDDTPETLAERILREEQVQCAAGHERSSALACDVRCRLTNLETSRNAKADRHGRINMRAGNIAERVNHRQHDQTKSERNAYVRDDAAAYLINHNCARAGENERKRTDEFCA